MGERGRKGGKKRDVLLIRRISLSERGNRGMEALVRGVEGRDDEGSGGRCGVLEAGEGVVFTLIYSVNFSSLYLFLFFSSSISLFHFLSPPPFFSPFGSKKQAYLARSLNSISLIFAAKVPFSACNWFTLCARDLSWSMTAGSVGGGVSFGMNIFDGMEE